MRELKRLLFLEIRRAVKREGRSVAEAGEAEHLAAQQAAPAAKLLGTAVLNSEVGVSRKMLNRDIADHVARRSSCRAERQANCISGEVAGQQKVAFGIEAVEQGPFGQLVQIAR